LRIFIITILTSISAVAADLAAGWNHSVAIKEGHVWSWGDNADGQLGQPDAGRTLLPRPVAGLDNVIAVSASRHTLALTADGKVYAWGRNSSGQLGNGHFGLKEKELRPIHVTGLSDITAIAAGWEHSIALSRNGTVFVWGSRSHGQLGDGICKTGQPASQPIPVAELKDIIAIAAGGEHSLALRKDGTLFAWGNNWNGQLGSGTSNRNRHYAAPQPVVGRAGKGTLEKVVSIAAGALHSAAVTKDGLIYAWGYNGSGQVPTGKRGGFWGTKGKKTVYTPTLADPGGNKETPAKGQSVAAGNESIYVLTAEGTVLSAGWSIYGELGDGSYGRNRDTLGSVISGREVIWKDSQPGSWQPSLVYLYTDLGHVNTGVKDMEVVDFFNAQPLIVGGSSADGSHKSKIKHNAGYIEMEASLIYPAQIKKGKPVSCLLTGLTFGSHAGDNDFATEVRLRWTNTKSKEIVDIPLSTGKCVYAGNVPPLGNIVTLVGGMHHALARDRNGDIWAWGHNGFGQLGSGNVSDGIIAKKVGLFDEATQPLPPKPQSVQKPDFNPPEGKVINVKEHGAKGDGTTLDQQALQKVIDECGKQGGGIVWFPPGTYRTGSLELRNGVRLHLNAGAVILAATNCELYPQKAMIKANDLNRIAVTGKGVINALGYFTGARGWRHNCIHMENCRDVLIEGVSTINSGAWTQHYIRCIGLTIRDATVRSLRPARNNDGIDLSGCENVRIEGCTVISDDDAIVIKSQTAERINRNIKAIGNICHTYRGAFKLGTETRGRYENIVCRDLTCYGSKALELYSVDGSETSNIVAENIKAYDALIALNIKLGARLRSSYWNKGLEPKVGYLRDISIKNLDVEIGNKSWREILIEHNIPDAEWANGKPETPYDSCISGLPGHIIENVVIENMNVRVPGGETAIPDPAKIPEKPEAYPHGGNFGTLPAYGLFIRHTRNISLKNIDFKPMQADTRPAIASFDVEGLVRE
jgi:alpha-tubulin suppressor-like RCC1 family protein/polygalacturonase